MSDPNPTPSFPILLQRFFVEHLGNQRAASPRTIAAYRDTFRLLLGFAEAKIGKAPTRLILADLNAQLILDFLDHLEKERSNGVRTRNARGEVIVDGAAVAHLHGKGRKDRSVPLWRTTVGLIRNWKRRLAFASEEDFLFPNRSGGRMARSNVTQRFELAVSAAAERYPQLASRSISPHTIRHTTAMHLLQSGVATRAEGSRLQRRLYRCTDFLRDIRP